MEKILTYEMFSLGGSKGIFSSLFQRMSELNELLGTPEQCEIEFTTRYLSRRLSVFMDYIIKTFGSFTEDGEYFGTTNDGINRISTYIESMFRSKWSGLYTLSKKEYDPLKPFNITLTETSSDNLETIKDSSTYEDNDDTYGFNSTEGVPSDKSHGSSNREYARDITRGRDYTRVGNIGNTSYQDLIKQEREVLDYKIKDVIFTDIATIICRGKYL